MHCIDDDEGKVFYFVGGIKVILQNLYGLRNTKTLRSLQNYSSA